MNLHSKINQLEMTNTTNEKEIAALKAKLLKQREDFESRLLRLENSQRSSRKLALDRLRDKELTFNSSSQTE